MVRIVKDQDYAEKRKEILDSAQRLVFSKGYERLTIQDILQDLDISKGALYHYFDSKQAVLEALIERMQQQAEAPLLPLVHDPDLNALEKLQQFFDSLSQLRADHQTFLVGLLQVWYADDNAIVRQKVDESTLERRAPLMTEIVHQGIREGVFTPAYPDQAGHVVLTLALGVANTLGKLLLSPERERDEAQYISGIIAIYGAYTDAIERVLGAPSGYLHRYDAEAVKQWVATLRGDKEK
jgi:AcrR family transcriptional regulator